MLLPALNKVRSKAKEIKCAGNVKQYSAMFSLYQNDFNGYYIHLFSLNTNMDPAAPGWERGRMWSCVLNLMYGGAKVEIPMPLLSCPSNANKIQAHVYGYSQYGYNALHIGSSYRYGTNDWWSAPCKNNGVKKTSETDIIADAAYVQVDIPLKQSIGCYTMYEAYTPTPSPNGTIFGIHSGRANVLWGDGHVSAVRPVTLGAGTGGSSKWDRY
jgi:prepilin-type processing-associated H-X9-DG protein